MLLVDSEGTALLGRGMVVGVAVGQAITSILCHSLQTSLQTALCLKLYVLFSFPLVFFQKWFVRQWSEINDDGH